MLLDAIYVFFGRLSACRFWRARRCWGRETVVLQGPDQGGPSRGCLSIEEAQG